MKDNLQTWANIVTIITGVIALIALGVSLHTKNKVNKLEQKITNINIQNLIIHNYSLPEEKIKERFIKENGKNNYE